MAQPTPSLTSLSTGRTARDAFFKPEPLTMPLKLESNIVSRPREMKDKDTEKDDKDREQRISNNIYISQKAPEVVQSSKSARETSGYIGFANLPNQVYRRSVKKGFEFTLMVVGESGLGKSTLINSMFLTDIYNAEYMGPTHRIKKTIQVEATKVLLKEGGVNLVLSVVDTPGFGDAVDNSNCWQPVTDFIEKRYEEFLNAEMRVNRKAVPDNRVHCCLYFISPNGHGLKPLDVEFMKRLHDKVNIIPLIAKADTMTPDECRDFKKTILNEIAQHKIRLYDFPECDDPEENKQHKKLKDRVPFAVVGSNTVVEVAGHKARARAYPWGIVEVENLEHNDFLALRNMVIRTHLQDLKDITNNVHYENYRYNKLASVSSDGKVKSSSAKNPMVMIEEERQEHLARLKKMESEMEQVFELKVKEKKQKMKDSEIDLQKRAEQMKKSLEQQEVEIEEKRKMLEKELTLWEETQGGDDPAMMEGSTVTLDKKKLKKGLF